MAYDSGVSFCEGVNLLFFAGLEGSFARRVSWIHLDLRRNSFALGLREFSRVLGKYDDFVFVSRGNRESFSHFFPDLERERLHVIYNPVDVSGILRKSLEVENIPSSPPGRFRIMSVGRLVSVKRFDRLIKACKMLCANGCQIELFILGSGPDAPQLNRLIAELDLGDDVHLIPFQENPYPWLKSADVFVSSSDSEGLPLVVSEAMILGVPIVATRTVGAGEVLENGKYGVLTDFSELALAEALMGLYREPQLRESCKKALHEALEKKLLPFSATVESVERIL
ncbi:MAG: glycosyltransferase [Puniceicoccales bacterium]|nr:glycosyltransferase [Puniceicoccales bacterium]